MLHRQLHRVYLEGLDILRDVENVAGRTDVLLSETEDNVFEVNRGTCA
jgi:hypothetical protein